MLRQGDDVGVLVNVGNGTFAASVTYLLTYAVGQAPVSVAAADLNGDGKPDVAVVNYLGSSVSVLLNACLP